MTHPRRWLVISLALLGSTVPFACGPNKPSGAAKPATQPAAASATKPAADEPVEDAVVRSYDVSDLIESQGQVDRAKAVQLADAIKARVAPNSWLGRGGSYGAIRLNTSSLVVIQSMRNHEQIEQVLADIRKNGLKPASPSTPSAVPK